MGFENDRKWIIEKKNDVAIKAMDNKEKTDQFIEKRDEVEEGISRIPTDLPEAVTIWIPTMCRRKNTVIHSTVLLPTAHGVTM